MGMKYNPGSPEGTESKGHSCPNFLKGDKVGGGGGGGIAF